MTRTSAILLKFGIYVVVMSLLTGVVFLVFGDYRTGNTNRYSAVFTDVSRLKPGDSVRVAGVRVGVVDGVSLRPDDKVEVTFNADRDVVLTTGTNLFVRYLNLVGDRYLELQDGPGSTRILPNSSEIPTERTRPALDLDLLLGGLKPLVKGLDPKDVNALTTSLLQILQGQDGTIESIFSRTSSFTNALADKGQVMQQVIDNLRTTVATLNRDSGPLSASIDHLDQLMHGLADDRDPVGTAIDQLATGTSSLADLLAQTRTPLRQNVEQLNRLAPLLANADMPKVETAIQRAPENYRKLVRLGSYGSFINFYLCGLSLRVSDLQGRTALFPWIRQATGRCSDSS